jgi:hypothetical protein
MNITLAKALVALTLVTGILIGLVIAFFRRKSVPLLLQLLGAACLGVVVLTHVCEALHLLPWMHWGEEHSIGHYLDLGSAILGLTLLPVGYLIQMLAKLRA